MSKRYFFLIRDKLGDSVIAFQALAAFRAAHPADDLTVMVHAHYLPLFTNEPGYRWVAYRSSFQANFWALRQRLMRRHFDAMVVLRGFGDKVRRLAAILPTTRRIHAMNRYPETFTASPPLPTAEVLNEDVHIAPAMRALRMLDPALQPPVQLHLPALKALSGRAEFVAICPVSDEIRRSLFPEDVRRILPELARRHPGVPVRVLVRHTGEGGFEGDCLPGVEVHAFESIPGLLAALRQSVAYYGCDTGLYHVAAAMDVPAVVFFGPSQPHKVILPAQRTEAVRLAALGRTHCDFKGCQTPICIQRAVARWGGQPQPAADYPSACPLPQRGDAGNGGR